jgi:hypothetical protein
MASERRDALLMLRSYEWHFVERLTHRALTSPRVGRQDYLPCGFQIC